ncbi:hypothetical protein [Aeromonas caviae]|uniref:hypothetical protein n=1 Tax=Aeromonas caviae TaxID=648 RepID=UPI002441DFF8|nr:hypothetical protein [Aeromonas caviae]
MIDFELDQEQKMLTDAIRRLAEERIRKVFRDADEETDRNCHFGFFCGFGSKFGFSPRTTTVFAPRTTNPIRIFRQRRLQEV